MLYFDIKTSIRNIFRNKVQSTISILGLGIGLGCILLLLALIVHETSFNRFIPGYRYVYRVILGESPLTQYPLAEEMKKDFPEVNAYFRYYQTNSIQLKNQKNELVRDRNLGFADPSIYEILGIRLISGSPAIAMNEVTISDETASKYFGSVSPLGAIFPVKINDQFENMTVAGVFEAFPSTSTLNPNFIANIRLSERMINRFQRSLGDFGSAGAQSLDWKQSEFLTFLVLGEKANVESLCSGMERYKELFMNDRIRDLKYTLQPAGDIYLRSDGISQVPFLRNGNPGDLRYYKAISIMILLISVLNYILLTRASISDRLKELGTRKAFGATRKELWKQIIIESNIVALMSLVPASFVIDYGIDFINEVLNKTLSSQIFENPLTWILMGLVVIFTGTVSGFVIGFNFSRIPSLLLLSGKLSERTRENRWTYSFLVIHFSIYVVLVASVITLSRQIKFSQSSYRGINPDNVIVSDLNTDELKKNFQAITDEIGKIPGVVRVAGGSFIPPLGNYLPITLATVEGERVRFDGLIMGEGMAELLGIDVIEGSSFGPYVPGKMEILMNESAAKKHEVKAGENFLAFSVRGILKDFNAHSLHTPIEPMVILQQNPQRMGLLAIKTDATNNGEIIATLRELYSRFAPDEIFEVSFLTDQIAAFYTRERNQATIIGAFSVLAAILSMLGLFGITLISISKKTKEIGIRKVNGARLTEILILLNSGYIKWVAASLVVGIPVAVYLMSEWLERFAYKTELSWWIFASSGVSAIFIAITTVSWQSLRAASRNPVEALRYE